MAEQPEQPAPAGDLAQFVEETLVQIIEGIVGAQIRVDALGAQINPAGQLPQINQWTPIRIDENRAAYLERVEFDVAVTRSNEQADKLGGGIRVMGIGVGGNVESADSMTRVSRLRFSVPVLFPGDPNLKAEEAVAEQRRKLAQSRTQRRRNWVTDY